MEFVRVNAADAWAMGFHGEGMVVADNDTGVEYTHPALVNKYRGNLGGGNFDHNYSWWDAWGGAPSPVPVDYDGHGTHTMGTMVGDDGGCQPDRCRTGCQMDRLRGYERGMFPVLPGTLGLEPPKPRSIQSARFD